MTRDEMLDKLMRSYASSYDLVRLDAPDADGLVATGHFHVTEESYMISQKAKMWSVNSDEYVWFFSVPRLTDAMCEKCIRRAYDEGMAKIDPNGKNQMVTRLVAIFLHDGAEEEAEKRVRKCRLYKSFQFSLKGWMEFHAVAVDLGKESVVNNGYGRETAKFLKNLLHPKQRGKGNRLWGIFKEMLH